MKRNSNEPSAAIGHTAASPILPGVFVHRMGENPEDERSAARFWSRYGCTVQDLEDVHERFSRHPDLLLLRDGDKWAYCEVKTVWQHRHSIHVLHQDAEEVRTETTGQSVAERVSGDLLTAIRQLRAENPAHGLLNFLLLVNRDASASMPVLSELFAPQKEHVSRSLKARREGLIAREMQELRKTVDLCLWTTPSANGDLAVEGCFLFNPTLKSFAEEITGMRRDKVISLEPAA